MLTSERLKDARREDRQVTLSSARYNLAAIILHWAIAILILIQISIGYYMNDILSDHSEAQNRVLSLHVSIGLTTLLLILVRVAIRLVYRPPPLPFEFQLWERIILNVSHIAFYVLMLGLPITGWFLVSADSAPILFWGIDWPKLPGAGSLGSPGHGAEWIAVQQVHTQILAWAILVNLGLHIAGAVRHQFEGRTVLWRMIPRLKSPPRRRTRLRTRGSSCELH